MIARGRLLLLEAVLVLLVDDDQSKTQEGEEDAGTDTYDKGIGLG